MDTQTRYDTLRHQGFQDSAIAAIIGVEWTDLEAHIVDPGNVPAPTPSGGGDLTLPLSLEAASGSVLRAGTTGDTQARVDVNADGTISWTDGVTGPQIELSLDDINNGNNALGVFGISEEPSSFFTLFGGVDKDGTVTDADHNVYAALQADATGGAGVAMLTLGRWSGTGETAVLQGGGTTPQLQLASSDDGLAQLNPSTLFLQHGSAEVYTGSSRLISLKDKNQVELLAVHPSTGNTHIGGGLVAAALPTSDPALAGALWNNAGVINVSAG